jgi:hypothetical protein
MSVVESLFQEGNVLIGEDFALTKPFFQELKPWKPLLDKPFAECGEDAVVI